MKLQPSSKSCFVCGVENKAGLHLRFKEATSGEVVAEYVVPEEYQGYPGVVHGGIIAAMLDEISGRVFMRDEPPRFMVTAKLNIRYRKPVPTGKRLLLKGYAVKDQGRIAEGRGEIFDEAGTLLAEADGIFVNIPDGTLAAADAAALGWRVYPEEEDR